MSILATGREHFDLVLCDVSAGCQRLAGAPFEFTSHQCPKQSIRASFFHTEVRPFLHIQVLELARKARSDLAFVMLSSHDDARFVQSSVALGADAYLFKPIRMQDMRGIWQFTLRQRQEASRKVRQPSLTMDTSNLSLDTPPMFVAGCCEC